MQSQDIPQADQLRNIRKILDAIDSGAANTRDIVGVTTISARHVGYAIRAAHILNLLTATRKIYELTRMGRDLLKVKKDSAAELRKFRTAIEASVQLQRIAPNLLGNDPPSKDFITQRILALVDNIAPATARRRAGTLLAWRRQIVGGPQTNLFRGSSRKSAAANLDGQPPLADSYANNSMWVRSIEAQRYGPLRDANVGLGPFCVMIGRNATGKSTLMDSLALVSDCLRDGVPAAMRKRASQFEDLLWQRQPGKLAFAFEFHIPKDIGSRHDIARYEVGFGSNSDNEVCTTWERLYLRPLAASATQIHHAQAPKGWRRVLGLSSTGAATYKGERESQRWTTEFKLSTSTLALANLPQDDEKFLVTNRLRTLLMSGAQRLALQPSQMTRPCSPLTSSHFLVDGSNLAIVVKRLLEDDPNEFQEWTDHLREALPDVDAIDVVEREEDRHLYLKLTYRGGLRIPIWRVSEGTLRIIALTLIPFAARGDSIFLIEEPENGVHPQALEAVHQALRMANRTQIIMASHSPVFIGILKPSEVLCFSRRGTQTKIIPGSNHPALINWRQDVDIGSLFASNVLD